MEIILTKQCLSLTGCLGRGYGYFIQRRRAHDHSIHFYSQRSKHPPIPHDGHLRFIFLCAEIAQNHLHVTEVNVPKTEIIEALREAGFTYMANCIEYGTRSFPDMGHYMDVLKLKETIYL